MKRALSEIIGEEVKEIEKVDKGIDADNFVVLTDKNKFFMKVYTGCLREEVEYTREILLALNEESSCFIEPRSVVFEMDGNPCILYNFIDGRCFSAYSISKDSLKTIARTQCLMHGILEKVRMRNKKDRMAVFDLDFCGFFKLSLENGIREFILGEIDSLKKESIYATRQELKKTIIHDDLSADNILLKDGVGNNTVFFVDFDDAHYGEAISDVAIVVTELILKNEKVDCGLIRYYIEEYNIGGYLDWEEFKHLFFFIKRRTLFMLAYYLYKRQRSGDDSYGLKIEGEMEMLRKINANRNYLMKLYEK